MTNNIIGAPYNPALLRRALRHLAADCDHAHDIDGVGFSKFDATFGHRLAALAAWTPRQTIAAWRLARRYRRQLEEAGIPFDRIPVPPGGEG